MTAEPEVLAAMAQRMNRLTEVKWDRCVIHDDTAVAYGWIYREDEHADFVLLDFSWGETEGLDGKTIPWIGVGFSTSSAIFSALINQRLRGDEAPHKDCERIEDVFGELVDYKVKLA